MKEETAKQLAIGMALLCVRNTFLEDLHAGIEPATPAGDYSDVKVVTPVGEIPWTGASRIRNDEMRQLMKEVVNKLYTILLRLDDAEFVTRMSHFSQRMTRHWDEPEYLDDWFTGQRQTPRE
jgi:hypothetical protein